MTDEDTSSTNLGRRRMLQASGAGLAAALAGCSGGGGGDGGTTKKGDGGDGGSGGKSNEVHVLTDYTSKSWQNRWEKTIIPGFKEQNPDAKVNVEYTGMQGNAMQRLTTLLQSGNPPNSFQSTPDTTVPMHLQGQTIPTTDVVNHLEKKFGKVKGRESISWNGDFWYVPHGIYAEQVLNYRKDLLDKVGASKPETWNDLLSAAEAVDKDKDIEARGYGLSGVKQGKSGTDFEVFFNHIGGQYLKWTDKEAGKMEITFPEDKAIETLSFLEQLAEYSPDPSSISWGSGLKYWAGGRVAMQLHLNAWPAGVAASAGADTVAKGSEVALTPKKKGAKLVDRGWSEVDSATMLDAPNADMAKDFFKYLYKDKQSVIQNHAMEPTRFMPVYDGIVDQDSYKNIDLLSKYDGHLYDLNTTVRNDIMPKMDGEARVSHPKRMYVMRFPLISNMMNQVLIQGKNKKDAYREARSKFEKRLKEAREKWSKQ